MAVTARRLKAHGWTWGAKAIGKEPIGRIANPACNRGLQRTARLDAHRDLKPIRCIDQVRLPLLDLQLFLVASILHPQSFHNEVEQPRRANEQKLQVFQKGWFLTFDLMSDKLKNPGHDKHTQIEIENE